MARKNRIDTRQHTYIRRRKQHALITRALMMAPDILLFHKPTSALESELTGEVLSVMQCSENKPMTMDSQKGLEEGKPEDIFLNLKQQRTR